MAAQEPITKDQMVEDLTLWLLYLSSSEEQAHEDLIIHRAQRGSHFEALGAVEAAGCLSLYRRGSGLRRGNLFKAEDVRFSGAT